MCGPPVGGAMVLCMTAFLSNTQLMGELTHCNRIFREISQDTTVYTCMTVELQIRHMSKFGVELSLFSK